jgi:DNA-binding transcriptional LysR family regulator
MTTQDRKAGRLMQILTRHTQDVRQPIHALYYRNTAISSRIASFIDYLIEALGGGTPVRRAAAWADQ